MRKKLLSLILAAALAFSGIAPGTGTQEVVAAETEKQEIVIDVTDYGVYPDSGKDSAVGIQEAVEAAKQASDSGKSVVINFPEGRYDIYPDKAVERELYISNTVGSDQNYKNKKIGIFLEDMDHVTVNGNGSLFMFHGKMMTFAAIDCEDVEFKNFTVDFQVPTVIDVTVESTSGNKAVLYIPECYNYKISGTSVTWLSDVSPYTGEYYWTASNLSHVQRFDTVTGLKPSIVTGIPALQNVSSIKDLGDHRLEITYTSKPDTVVTGMCFEARPTVRDHAGTFFWKCKDVKLTSLDIQFLHGFGMVGQHSENITLESVNFQTPAETGRASASYADFVQMSGCKGTININNCTFVNPHDDPINIHGTFNKITAISADRKTITVQYMHNETAGFPNFFEGDEIEIMTAGNMITVEDSVRKVVKVDGPDGMGGTMGEGTGSLTKIKLTLDEAIPAEVAVNSHVVENITYTPTVNITNCVFKEVTTRGILVTTRQPILIENNIFDGTRMASIYISDDAQSWYESGPVRDVVIRGNVFMRGKSQAIFIEPTNPTVSTEKTVHSNITIEDNIFFMENQKVLDAKSVKDLTFRNNKIYRQDPISGNGSLSLAVKSGSSAALKVSETAELQVSGSGNTLTNRLYSFNGCKNVVIENNEYDGGLNAGSSISNMSSSDIKINNDIVKVSADNTTAANGTMVYESDNEEVVKVSASGVVTAVGAGNANVTAYMSVGGRNFPTNSVTFTVSDGAQGNLPTGIEVTAEKEAVTAGETVDYTAELKWNSESSEETSKISWKVTDAETGADTDKAVISEEGILTTQKAGAVVVTASTVNGYEASKLLTIWQGGKTIASDITVEYASGSDKYRASTTVEGGLELDFTSQGLFNNQSPSNVLVKELPEGTDRTNLTLIFKLTGATPNNTWADAGMYLYDDADNYIALQKKHRDGTTSAVALVREQNGSGSEAEYNSWANVPVNPIWMKLEKAGAVVTAYFSADGSEWTKVGSKDNCNFLSDSFKIAIASQGTTSGSMTYSDVTVNGKELLLVEEAVKPSVSKAEVTYTEAENSLNAVAESNGEAVLIKWAVSDTENGNYSVAGNLTGATVTASAEMNGKYVKAAVIPLTREGAAGEIFWSAAVKVTGAGADSDSNTLKSANAALETASITGIGAGEVFAFTKGTNFYQTTADVTDREIRYSFKAEDPKASVKVIVNDEEVQGTSGTAVLHNARNLIEVLVTAEDGVTYGYYRFTISRTGDSRTALKTLVLGDQEVELEDGVYEYSYTLAENTESMKILAEAESDLATVTIVNDMVKAAETLHKAEETLSLHKRTNEITVKIASETSAEPVYYRLKLKVPDASNANLENLSFGEYTELRETFDKDQQSYIVDTTTDSVTINAAAEENDATVEIIRGTEVVKKGTGSVQAVLENVADEEKVTVKITSKDQTKKIYELTIVVLEQFALKVSVNDADMGRATVTPNQTLFDENTEVTVKAVPTSGQYEFVGWYQISNENGTETAEKIEGAGATYTFKMTDNLVLRAEFRMIPSADDSRDIPRTEMTATAGDYQSGEGPEMAIDGNTGTTWHTNWHVGSDHTDHWFQLELTETYMVDGLRYLPRQSGTNGIITKYEVYTSLDGTKWEKAAEGEWTEDSSWKMAQFTAREAKYVKLVTLEAMSDQSIVFASAAEIRLTGGKDLVVSADKTALEAAIKEAKALKEEDYTAESWKAADLANVIASAEEVVKDENASQEAVDAKVKALEEAVAKLEEKTETPVEENEVVRLSGSDRYATGIAAADELKAVLGVEKFDTVVIATGKNYADALSGSYLAAVKNAPILLTSGKAANVAELHAYIKANVKAGATIYVLGGEAAVSKEAATIEGYDVTRLAGGNRYETNLAILAEAGVEGQEDLLVATGKSFADSLSASAASRPILLVKPNAALTDDQKAVAADFANIYVIGGEGAVSAATAKELAAYGSVTRLSGASRYETSVAVAEAFFTDPETVILAYGKNFPDGLCGGALAAALNAPLILTKEGSEDAAAAYVAANGIASGYVLGGDGVLPNDTVVTVFGLDSAADIK